MEDEHALRIVSADRLEDSVIIGFSDGRSGRYSTSLLYDMLPQSEELQEFGSLDDSEPDGVGAHLLPFKGK